MSVVLLFPSIHYVLKAEKKLKEAGLKPDMIPVPKELSSDCGMALALGEEEWERARGLLSGNLSPERVFRREGGRYEALG